MISTCDCLAFCHGLFARGFPTMYTLHVFCARMNWLALLSTPDQMLHLVMLSMASPNSCMHADHLAKLFHCVIVGIVPSQTAMYCTRVCARFVNVLHNFICLGAADDGHNIIKLLCQPQRCQLYVQNVDTACLLKLKVDLQRKCLERSKCHTLCTHMVGGEKALDTVHNEFKPLCHAVQLIVLD